MSDSSLYQDFLEIRDLQALYDNQNTVMYHSRTDHQTEYHKRVEALIARKIAEFESRCSVPLPDPTSVREILKQAAAKEWEALVWVSQPCNTEPDEYIPVGTGDLWEGAQRLPLEESMEESPAT